MNLISNFAMAGMMVTFVACIILPVTGIIYCIKKTGRTNILFVAVIGLAAMSVANSLSSIITSLKPIVDIAHNTFLLYMLIAAAVVGVVETLVRSLAVNYAVKTGSGFYRFLATGVGIGGGVVMVQASTYLQMFMQAQVINSGQFIEAVTSAENATVTAAEAQEYIDKIVALSPFTYYAEALDRIVIVLLQVALTLIFAKLFTEGKKGLAIGVTLAIRSVYEFFKLGTYYLSTEYLGYAVSETVGLILNAVLLLLVGAACVVAFFQLKKLIPAEYPAAPKKKVQVQAQEKKAWNELQNINQKNLSKIEFDDPYERKDEYRTDSDEERRSGDSEE